MSQLGRDAASDLEFVRQLAEEGATAPSLSGRFALWWSLLTVIALAAHWGVITGLVPLPPRNVGMIWMVFGVVGGVGSFILGASLGSKPGSATAGNRAEGAVWPVMTVALFTYATSLGFAAAFRKVDPIVFDTIIPMAFALHAAAAAMSAVLFRKRTPYLVVAASIVLIAASAFLVGDPIIYLIAALGVVLIQTLPGLVRLRAEPKSVV